jgi:hypothetical protein
VISDDIRLEIVKCSSFHAPVTKRWCKVMLFSHDPCEFCSGETLNFNTWLLLTLFI